MSLAGPDAIQPSFIHPALTSFADECCATLVRLTLNVGALALFAITGLHVWDQLQRDTAGDPADRPGFILASHSRPAFAVSLLDLPKKSGSYEIFRHPAGGRKDVFHWGPPDEKPVAELEIYRPGWEFDPSQPRTADLPRAWPARRAAIASMLDRLTMLASGNEPPLGGPFARAELKRGYCATTAAASPDWVTAAENPRPRGPPWPVRPCQGTGFHATFFVAPQLYSRQLWPI